MCQFAYIGLFGKGESSISCYFPSFCIVKAAANNVSSVLTKQLVCST
jgi:hypothetical protein